MKLTKYQDKELMLWSDLVVTNLQILWWLLKPMTNINFWTLLKKGMFNEKFKFYKK